MVKWYLVYLCQYLKMKQKGTSEITKIGLAGAIKIGHIPNQAPLGYKREDKRLVIDYPTKDVVERIFDLYYNGNSYQKISNILNEEQVLGKTNWQDSSIVAILLI